MSELKAAGTCKQGRRPMYQPFAKHTPGPWHLKRIGEELYIETDSGMIADMQRSDVSRYPDQAGDMSELEANARLIAAAPELLALLERMTGLLERQKLVAGEDEVEGRYLLLVQDARAAIAKAEGK